MNTEAVAALVGPIVEAASLELYDVEQKGATLRVSIDGPEGVPFEELERLSREISLTLDEHDPIAGSYMLEVSTPGVERTLRTAQHFEGAVGALITLKTVPGPDGRQRYRGELTSTDGTSVSIDDDERGPVTVAISDVESARTIFEWGPNPKPGAKGAQKNSKNQRRAS